MDLSLNVRRLVSLFTGDLVITLKKNIRLKNLSHIRYREAMESAQFLLSERAFRFV